MAGEATMVSLSRPARASSASEAPKTRPWLSSDSTSELQASAITKTRDSSFSRSTPSSAAGIMPK